jgi:hypothetical protein
VNHAHIVRRARSTTKAIPASDQPRVESFIAGRPAGSILAACALMSSSSLSRLGGRPQDDPKNSSRIPQEGPIRTRSSRARLLPARRAPDSPDRSSGRRAALRDSTREGSDGRQQSTATIGQSAGAPRHPAGDTHIGAPSGSCRGLTPPRDAHRRSLTVWPSNRAPGKRIAIGARAAPHAGSAPSSDAWRFSTHTWSRR